MWVVQREDHYDDQGPPQQFVSTKTAEQIQKEIADSKYLGGDMEHTHLVKGLDFALLNKMRSEQHAADKKQKMLEAEAATEAAKVLRKSSPQH